MRFGFLGLASGLVLMGCTDQAPVSGPTEQPPAPLLSAGGASAGFAHYIVVFRAGTTDVNSLTDNLISTHGGQVHYRYNRALQGFAATLPPWALDGIRHNPNVEFVEEDALVSVEGTDAAASSWGLDRIDTRSLPLDGRYDAPNTGAGVRVYILDTGVRQDHVEFGGRVYSGWDFVEGDGDASDCHGHGTHVAGTVAGANVGVAREATIVSVRVLDCGGSGSWSQILAGIDWIVTNHIKPAVVNMSLAGGTSEAVNAAVNNAVAAGITFAVAAGNENTDACSRSPAGANSALTIAATTSTDARASWSNWGSCVDLFAPGEGIYSASIDGGYKTMSGTSMATPHVSGVAALYLAHSPAATPSEVAAAIVDGATPDRVTGANGSPNRLLYDLIVGDGVLPPVPPAPPPPSPGKLHVADLNGTPTSSKGSWTANLSIQVRTEGGAPAMFALVTGTWSDGATGSASCTTNAYGWCNVSKGGIKKGVGAVQFTVGGISLAGGSYDASANSDPDGDSNGTTIRIGKP